MRFWAFFISVVLINIASVIWDVTVLNVVGLGINSVSFAVIGFWVMFLRRQYRQKVRRKQLRDWARKHGYDYE